MKEAPFYRGGLAGPTNARFAPERIRRLLLLLLLVPVTACANPVSLDRVSLVAFCVVVFWAFIVESGIVALILAFRGLLVLRMFFCYYVANALTFFLIFQPTLE